MAALMAAPYASAWRACRRRHVAFLLSMLALAVVGLDGHWYRLPMARSLVGWLMLAAVGVERGLGSDVAMPPMPRAVLRPVLWGYPVRALWPGTVAAGP